MSHNHKDFTHRFAGVGNALLELPIETAIDREIVALDQEGKPAFHLLLRYGGEAQRSEYWGDQIC
jgi:ATP-dependent DNA ligase